MISYWRKTTEFDMAEMKAEIKKIIHKEIEIQDITIRDIWRKLSDVRDVENKFQERLENLEKTVYEIQNDKIAEVLHRDMKEVMAQHHPLTEPEPEILPCPVCGRMPVIEERDAGWYCGDWRGHISDEDEKYMHDEGRLDDDGDIIEYPPYWIVYCSDVESKTLHGISTIYTLHRTRESAIDAWNELAGRKKGAE